MLDIMSEEDLPEDLIRYDVLTQQALRDVIRKVLQEVATSGLPGEHHFFITFRTDHPGVRLSTRMRERYPEEMTIVIQHSFWDLKITDAYFEIDLSFDDILERLRIPFSSLKGFFDPHVKFGVQFDAEYLEAANGDVEVVLEGNDDSGEVENLPQIAQTRDITKMDKKPNSKAKKKKDDSETDNAKAEEKTSESAEIVSLDQFRNKR